MNIQAIKSCFLFQLTLSMVLAISVYSVESAAEVDPATGSSSLPGAAREKTPLLLRAKSSDASDRSAHSPEETLPTLLSADHGPSTIMMEKDNLVIYGEWLVSSDSMEQANREREQLSVLGIKIKQRNWLPKLGFVLSVYRVPPNQDPVGLMQRVRTAHPGMQIEYNQRYPLLNQVDMDPIRHFGHKLTDVPIEGCQAFKGTVAMMDSRVNAHLDDFASRNLEVIDIAAAADADVSDHGTSVAYLLFQLLPEAHLLAVNVYQHVNGEMETRSDWLLAGFEKVLAQDSLPQVLNMSFGGNRSALLERAVEQVSSRGIRLVAAAGNGGRQARPVFPAAYEVVAAVSALDADQQLWVGSNRGEYIRYAAPGVDIWAPDAYGQARFVTGTSYAAPWVSAVAALAGEEQWAKPAEVARDLGKPGRDSLFGFGLVQFSSLCHK